MTFAAQSDFRRIVHDGQEGLFFPQASVDGEAQPLRFYVTDVKAASLPPRSAPGRDVQPSSEIEVFQRPLARSHPARKLVRVLRLHGRLRPVLLGLSVAIGRMAMRIDPFEGSPDGGRDE